MDSIKIDYTPSGEAVLLGYTYPQLLRRFYSFVITIAVMRIVLIPGLLLLLCQITASDSEWVREPSLIQEILWYLAAIYPANELSKYWAKKTSLPKKPEASPSSPAERSSRNEDRPGFQKHSFPDSA